MTKTSYKLRLKQLGIDTHQEAVIYMRPECHVCRAEGFNAQAHIRVSAGDKWIIATLNQIEGDILAPDEAGLSKRAWDSLGVNEGEMVSVSHAQPLDSLSLLRAKVYGKRLKDDDFVQIMQDIVSGRYSDIHISSFLTACAAKGLDLAEITSLTKAMISVGKTVTWDRSPIVDKHCVGGLPGNRTTPIVVAIVTACGLIMPKTSSRAITSPAGTADTMETLAPVDLPLATMREVVDKEGGCIVWGGGVELSPADDTLIRVERALDLDSEGQLVASILSKKIAAGSTHIVLDMPIGPTAKVRSTKDADVLSAYIEGVAKALGLVVHIVRSDGLQPVGRGFGPALEARDVLAVLQNQPDAPVDLQERSIMLAGILLEMGNAACEGAGAQMAREVLADGRAWRKFQAICEAQGGMRVPPRAGHTHEICAEEHGRVVSIDNRRLAKVAKLAGAPDAKAAGLMLHAPLGHIVKKGAPLFTVHAETQGELVYALDYAQSHTPIIMIEDI